MWTNVQRLVLGFTEPSEFGCKVGRYFYRSRLTGPAEAFAQIINMRETGPWDTDWIVIRSEEAMSQTSLFTFSHALNDVHTIRSCETV